jgi:hypothetical protein
VALLAVSGCNTQYVHECNAVKRTVDPLVAQINAKPRPREMKRLPSFLDERAKDYEGLAASLEGVPVETRELASSLQNYADAARRYAGEAKRYVSALDDYSPEQVDAARRGATTEHESMVAASRSVAGWCQPFGP